MWLFGALNFFIHWVYVLEDDFNFSFWSAPTQLPTATVAKPPSVETKEYGIGISFFNPPTSSISSRSSKSKPKPVQAQPGRNPSDVPAYPPIITVFGNGGAGRGNGIPNNVSSMIKGTNAFQSIFGKIIPTALIHRNIVNAPVKYLHLLGLNMRTFLKVWPSIPINNNNVLSYLEISSKRCCARSSVT